MNAIFGENLRQLCANCPSIAAVARDLQIGKVQFHRYLNGESFPKPNVLSKICDYFDVDARIMLERLESQPDGTTPLEEADNSVSGWIESADYIARGQKLFDSEAEFPDGLYANWREAHSHPGTYLVALLQLITQKKARFLKGYDAKELSRGTDLIKRSDREFRGLLIRQPDGYCGLFFHAPTNPLFSMVCYRPSWLGLPGPTFCGRVFLARPSRKFVTNEANSVLNKLPDGLSPALDVLRKKPFFDAGDVPDVIRSALRDGV